MVVLFFILYRKGGEGAAPSGAGKGFPLALATFGECFGYGVPLHAGQGERA